MSTYQPGRCNIGPHQRRRRLGVALAAAVVAVGYALVCIVGPVPELLLLGVFIPLSVAFEWGIQAYTAFCVRLALLNRYDFGGAPEGEEGEVSEAAAQHEDHVYAAKITVVAVTLAAVTTVLLILVF